MINQTDSPVESTLLGTQHILEASPKLIFNKALPPVAGILGTLLSIPRMVLWESLPQILEYWDCGLVVTMVWYAKTPPNKKHMRVAQLLWSAAPIVAVALNASPRLFVAAFNACQMLARPRDLKYLVGLPIGMAIGSLFFYPIFGGLMGTLKYARVTNLWRNMPALQIFQNQS